MPHPKTQKAPGQVVQHEVGRQLEKAMHTLQHAPIDGDAVHQLRSHVKKTRAALRLMEDDLGRHAYKKENTSLRRAGASLQEVRDAEVRLKTLQKLAADFPDALKAKDIAPFLRKLQSAHKALVAQILKKRIPARLRRSLSKTRAHVATGKRHGGWKTCSIGLKRTYRQGRVAFQRAKLKPTTTSLHAWRKQAKYLLNQLKLLVPMLPPVAAESVTELDCLTELLGENHDLAMLRESVLLERRLPTRTANKLLALIDRRHADLAQQALARGRQIYLEKPKAFVQRITGR